MRAQQQVQGIRDEAEREILANRAAVQERAQQWVTEYMRPLQQQIAICSQQLAGRDSQLMKRDIRIARLQSELALIQQRNAHEVPVATPTPIPESPMTVHTEFDLFEGQRNNPFTSDLLDGSATPINTPPRQPTGMSPRESPLIHFSPVAPGAEQPATSSQNMSSADQVSKLMQALHTQTQLVAQLQAAKAPMPIAPPPSAPTALALGGAALSAPSGSRRSIAANAPLPQQVLPPGLPPLPLSRPDVLPQGIPCVYNSGSQRSNQSGSCESSSDSDAGPPRPNPFTQCRICGEFHDDINCPTLTMNNYGGYFPDQGPDQRHPGDGSVRDYSEEEDNTIRVKSLNDLVFPNLPGNAGQARGYVNQVLMAIGKLQKTPGKEVYQWAQECLTPTEERLKSDPRFPRTDREIASKLIKTCRRGRFGLIFQQMFESERLSTGSMPCGRVMLKKIFRYFQLERGRIGMLGERNLLSLRIPGNTHADLQAFRDKNIYVMSTIAVQDLPREQTLFNHLIDELERTPSSGPLSWLIKCWKLVKPHFIATAEQQTGRGKK